MILPLPVVLNLAMKKQRSIAHNLKIKESLLKIGRASKPMKKCPKCQQFISRIHCFRQKKNRTASYCFDCEKQDGAKRFAEKQAGKIHTPRKKRGMMIVSYERLISNTDKCKNPKACWNWLKSKNEKGYGKTRSEGKLHYTHRLSWELVNGKIPVGLFVLHKCDNPSCINPNHLFLGTSKDNFEDMMKKGRSNHPTGIRHGSKTKPDKVVRGEKIFTSKLNTSLVLEIREIKKSTGVSNNVIAEKYGVTPPTIRHIVNRTSWTHI